jgi:hypothetical protein
MVYLKVLHKHWKEHVRGTTEPLLIDNDEKQSAKGLTPAEGGPSAPTAKISNVRNVVILKGNIL